MNRRLFVLAAMALGGCATAAPSAAPTPPAAASVTPAVPALSELEPLYRAEAGREALTVSVASNGCTAKADFVFYVDRKGPSTQLAFARKRVDTCKSFAMGRTDLSFTWTELGLSPQTQVFLLNPLVGWTGPGG